MGLFSKKTKQENKMPVLPKLPDLPALPTGLGFPETKLPEEIHELPSFPTSEPGEKFSQDTIKNAIGDEEEKESFEMEPFVMPKTPKEPTYQNMPLIQPKTQEAEPVFIRIDKFEQSLEIFEKTKSKINQIEELFRETKELKEKEAHELSLWENEIQKMKLQIDKVDKDIFSKI